MQKPIRTGGSINSDRVKHIKALLEKHYENKIAVISLEQQGNYGKEVHITAKIDLTDMNKKSLRFYSFDVATNTFIPLNPPPRYFVDETRRLQFDTAFAGDIVVTDRPLTKKCQLTI